MEEPDVADQLPPSEFCVCLDGCERARGWHSWLGVMSEEELIKRIDLALRAQPLPPERLLRRIIQELQQARGGEADYGDDDYAFEDSISYGSNRGGSSRGGSSRGGSSQVSYDSVASRCVTARSSCGPQLTCDAPTSTLVALPWQSFACPVDGIDQARAHVPAHA